MEDYQELTQIANRIRRDIVRMISAAKSGHPGGALSATEILTALFFREMRIDPGHPKWPERDRFVLSKGHACAVLYAALAERGFFPRGELGTFRRINSHLQGHPASHKTAGVEACAGSLGQGLSQAVGMALAGKLDGQAYRVFALIGDGEIQEGQIWEAAMAAAHYQLDNLTVFLDFNNLQIDGTLDQVMSVGDPAAKFRAFGWETETIDGHDFGQIFAALRRAKLSGHPTLIVAKTVKGKGVSFMENQVGWHGTPPTPEQEAAALKELGADAPEVSQ